MNLVRGVSHVEFIKSRGDGKLYMLECAARVGGAHVADMIEAATGVNLWAEWAKIEIGAVLRNTPYALPDHRSDYGGLILTLARDERPDTSAFDAPEVVFLVAREEPHRARLIADRRGARIQELLAQYLERIKPLVATMPALEKPAS